MIMKVCSFSENENTTFIIIWIKFTELKDISRDIFKFKSEIYRKTKRTPIEILPHSLLWFLQKFSYQMNAPVSLSTK